MEINGQGTTLDGTLRSYVPEVAAEVTVRIRREVPALGAARYLDSFVESLIGHFLDLLDESGPPSDEILGRAREAGVREAAEGRGPDVLPAAARLGAGIAIARLSEHAERLGLRVEISAVGKIAQMVFAYTDRIAEAVIAGHGGSGAHAVGEDEKRRRELLDLLLTPCPGAAEIKAAARSAGWPMPRTVAVIALGAGGPRPVLPPDALFGLHLDEPCLLLPDPDGPARRRQVAAGLRGRTAAIGPTVGVADAARSLRWAYRTLSLVRSGRITAEGSRPVRSADHLPRLMTSWGADLVELVAADRLAPLDAVRPSVRRELEVTLLALLECHFRAIVTAARLHVHPQTVRYRLRRLEALFGEELYEPRNQLDMHLLLYARTRDRVGAARAD
ncbi:CdaR family transcriptional regulator [Actinomadura sp. WMMB 499]|uniref:PucR family transcriptional regulator n=1 Tax=Actinomadura sp. WMMB 499 TaxID=1219491 RepID=UPI001247551F|nr:helix-turn-helix domain-containing protein [Actinomadura sp. WMMB 499]QFG22202.1 PucR family transcriptional regulator [Actinomadura sp. WMMB 499]